MLQKEESEIWIGEWMKERKNRDQMVIATKFTTAYRAGYGESEIIINVRTDGSSAPPKRSWKKAADILLAQTTGNG